jgi:hypothetical protein
MIGLLYRALPFITLNNLNLLEMPGYIAGTNNVLFETMSNYYDLAIEIENDKMKITQNKEEESVHPEDESHYDLDLKFIKRLITRIKNKTIYDFEIKDHFATYTQTLLDLALSDDFYLENDDNRVIHSLAEQNAKRISLFRQTNLFKIYQHIQKFQSFEVRRGVSMLTLETYVRRLRIEQTMDEETLRKIFYDFSQFLSSGSHDTIIRFLYLLPRHKGGLHLIANA